MTSQQGIKKRGIRLLSFHGLRLSHCLEVGTDNAKPTLKCMYIYTPTGDAIYCVSTGMYNIPVGHLTLQCSWLHRNCDISNRQNKASINAYLLFMSCDSHPIAQSAWVSHRKGRNYFWNIQLFRNNFYVFSYYCFVFFFYFVWQER